MKLTAWYRHLKWGRHQVPSLRRPFFELPYLPFKSSPQRLALLVGVSLFSQEFNMVPRALNRTRYSSLHCNCRRSCTLSSCLSFCQFVSSAIHSSFCTTRAPFCHCNTEKDATPPPLLNQSFFLPRAIKIRISGLRFRLVEGLTISTCANSDCNSSSKTLWTLLSLSLKLT